MSSNNITTETTLNEKIQKTILLSGVVSMSIVLIVIIVIVIYCIIKNKADEQSSNLKSFSANKVLAKNTPLNPKQNLGFKSLQNSSSLGNDNNNQNNSLSEIKERNIKDEIHNIIHGNNNESGIQKKSKKKNKNKKNASELIEEISSQNDTKDLEDNIKNQIKQFVRDDEDK
jgi:hypothetical protein